MANETQKANWGGIVIPYKNLQVSLRARSPVGQIGGTEQIPVRFTGFEGGLARKNTLYDTSDANKYVENTGVVTHIPGGLYSPYVITAQSSISGGADISGARAANKRVHSVDSTIGQSKKRWYAFLDQAMFRTTSDSDASLTVISPTGLPSKVISGAGELVIASTSYVAVAVQADQYAGVYGCSDPDAATPAFVPLITAYDCYGFCYLPTFNGGTNVFYGRQGAVQGFSGMESGWTSWTLTDAAGGAAITADAQNVAYSGTYSARLVNTVSGEDSYESIILSASLVASETAVVSAWVNCTAFTGGATSNRCLYAYDDNDLAGTAQATTLTTTTSGWVKHTVTVTMSTNPGNLTLRLYAPNGTVLYDHVSWVSGTAPVDRIGVLLETEGRGSTWSTLTDADLSSSMALPSGGYMLGPNPQNQTEIGFVAPITSEITTTNVPRKLWLLTLSIVSSTIKGRWSSPDVLLDHVEHACPYLGGWAVTGQRVGSPGTLVHLLRSDDNVQDLNFPGEADGSVWYCYALKSHDDVLIARCVNAAGTSAQDWYFYDGAWHLSTYRYTVTANPIGWGGGPQRGAELGFRYAFLPNSTNTDVHRQFEPSDLFADPTLDTTNAKQTGALLTGVEMEVGGPFYTNKSVISSTYDGRWLSGSGAGSYGPLTLALSADGGTSFPAGLSHAFTSAQETKNYATSGTALPTLQARFTLGQGTANTSTPNALPVTVNVAASQKLLRDFVLTIDDEALAADGETGGFLRLISRIQTLANTKVTQRFRIGTVDVPAMIVAEGQSRFGLMPPEFNSEAKRAGKEVVLVLREVEGTTA